MSVDGEAIDAVGEVIDSLAEEAIATLQALIGIPSVNETLAPNDSPGGEGLVADHLAALAADAGLSVDLWEPVDGRRNVVAWPQDGRNGTGRSLLIGGHVDTVPAGDASAWRYGGPFSGQVEHGRVWGLGACDMKAGVAAAFWAVIALARAGIRLDGRVMAHGIIGEESGEYAHGSLGLVERGHRPDGVIIGEPTGGQQPLGLAIASVGWLFLRLEVSGRSTHVALRGRIRRAGDAGASDGVNALEKAHALVSSLLGLEKRWDSSKRHPLFESGDFCIHPGVFESRPGGIDNPATFAERATVMFSVLYPPHESAASIRHEVEDYIRDACAGDAWLREHPPTVTWPLDWPAAEEGADSPLVQAASAAIADVGRMAGPPRVPRLVGMQGVTDASWFQREGIPAIVCGPGATVDAHSAHEGVDIAEYLDAIRLYASSAIRWCGRDGS